MTAFGRAFASSIRRTSQMPRRRARRAHRCRCMIERRPLRRSDLAFFMSGGVWRARVALPWRAAPSSSVLYVTRVGTTPRWRMRLRHLQRRRVLARLHKRVDQRVVRLRVRLDAAAEHLAVVRDGDLGWRHEPARAMSVPRSVTCVGRKRAPIIASYTDRAASRWPSSPSAASSWLPSAHDLKQSARLAGVEFEAAARAA